MKIEDLKTFSQYAELKKISLKTVYNWIKIGKLKVTKIGKSNFIKIK